MQKQDINFSILKLIGVLAIGGNSIKEKKEKKWYARNCFKLDSPPLNRVQKLAYPITKRG